MALPHGDYHEHLRIGLRNSQKGTCGTSWLFAALLPAMQLRTYHSSIAQPYSRTL